MTGTLVVQAIILHSKFIQDITERVEGDVDVVTLEDKRGPESDGLLAAHSHDNTYDDEKKSNVYINLCGIIDQLKCHFSREVPIYHCNVQDNLQHCNVNCRKLYLFVSHSNLLHKSHNLQLNINGLWRNFCFYFNYWYTSRMYIYAADF